MIVAVSTDSFIAGPNNDMSWLSNEDEKLLKVTMQKHKTLLMGMGTYTTHEHRFTAPNKTRIIFTRSITPPLDPRVRFYNGKPEDVLQELSDSGTTEALLLGGAELYHYFLKKNVVNRVLLVTEPIMLESGTQLFVSPLALESEYGYTLESRQDLNANGTTLRIYKKSKNITV